MKRLLVDTHAALFWWAGSGRLSPAARDAMADEDAIVLFSAVSAMEIATKFRLGKLAFAGDPTTTLPRLIARHRFETLAIKVEHGLLAGALAGEHRDPFDRLIAAQALIEDLTVVTRDRELAAFGCKVLW